MSDNIKVVVKVRPLITRELEDKQKHQWRVTNNTLLQLDSNGRDYGPGFTFDKVYCQNTKTTDVFNDVARPIVEAAVAGFNGTIFAYGQTSSGKTYTMTGTDESPGIIPLAVLNLFEIIKKEPGRDFVVSVSYIEIYNETLRDLLDLKKTTIKIHENYNGGNKVDATERATASPDEVLEAMKEGNANRQTGSTYMNESSSRSHSIFQISIESREHIEGEEQVGSVNVSQLNLVDLAGSERAGQTGATGLRFKEGTLINKSLTSLALVIKQLSEEPNKYINYRDSKLTRILQNSLGGNAKTSIICTITTAAVDETISTLQFATRAKAIKNKPEVNAVATDATMIQKLTKELSKLQSELDSKKNLEVMLETKKNVEQDLQKKIANLQRFILNGCQRSNVEVMGGARRKLLPPRRVTISSLHSIQEDVPKIAKFCTPSLKYNPTLIQNPHEFLPIKNPSKLSSLPEEPPRFVTPPPPERKVNFSGEIIDLDSDDDDNSGALTCSPYHHCYVANKTPPCVLRKNAKQAEKHFNDLVELTEREKMYSPSVVELIEKIEQSNTKTAKLQDEIETVTAHGKEKDSEIETLRSKIKDTEEDIKSYTSVTLELETQHKELTAKLTDWEVSYETLKNKAKSREQELLSLLEEQRIKQATDIGKMPPIPKDKKNIQFVDIPEDTSSGNSSKDSNIVHPDEDEPSECLNVIAQHAAKNQNVTELEADINAQKQQIIRLENFTSDLQGQVNKLKEKLSNSEKENVLLKSTVNELNCTVENQKKNLKLAQNDMNSYNSVIQELQIKLTKKENLLNMHINDAILESMLANEEKTIANNENLKNIIHSFKLALENSKNEIDLLKSRTQNNNKSGDKNSMDDFEINTKQVEILNDEISKLTKQANENMVTINTLLREKGDLALIEQELIKKISEVEQINCEYVILNKEQASQIGTLKKDHEKLETVLAEKCVTEKEQLNINESLFKQIHELNNKVVVLDEDVKVKDTLIANLNTQNDEFQDCLKKAQLALNKLQDVFLILTGKVQEIPEIFDSFVVIYNTLYDSLNTLEDIAVETVAQKDLAHKNNTALKSEMAALVLQHKLQLSDVTNKTENLNESVQKLTNEIKLLKHKNSEQLNEIKNLQQKLNHNNVDLNNFEVQLKVCREADSNMREENSEKDLVISSFKGNEITFLKKIENLEGEVSNFLRLLKSKEDINQELCKKEEIYSQRLNELEVELQHKCIELSQAKQKHQDNEKANDLLVENIMRKLSNIIDNIKEKNASVRNSLMYESSNIRLHILPILDTIVDHVVMLSTVETKNKELESEMKIISNYNRSLNCDLKQSSELLQYLQEELKIKAAEIDTMTHKTKDWKEQFSDLDMSMKKQMLFLQSENAKLKTRCQKLNIENKMQLDLLPTEKYIVTSPKKAFIKSSAGCDNNAENISPPSLLTICCNRIIEAIDPKQNDKISKTTSSSCVGNINTGSTANCCLKCDQLVLELRTTQQENFKLMETLEQLKVANKELLKEQSEMHHEVRLLLEPTLELQKKIVNHRTNLSILTATTYAENKSLMSQVKVLQHHHNRFHNVCQRDLPEFKRQLDELMTILKDDSLFCDDFSFKRCSLLNLLENNSNSCQIRNDSTFDGDLLMLDTNVTITTADNTLVGYNQTCLDLTQNMFNETGFQTVDHNLTEPNVLSNQIDIIKKYNENMCSKVEILKKENSKLKEQVAKYLVKESKLDLQSSPTKISGLIYDRIDKNSQNNLKELELLTEQLSIVTKQKEDIEKKYSDLLLEIPSTDALVDKMKAVEDDLKIKVKELNKITDVLNAKSKDLMSVQEENDVLSTQVMDHISEADDLNKEVEKLKQQNLELVVQCQALQLDNRSKLRECPQSDINDEIHSKQIKNDKNHSTINRSSSDSDTTSRYNKICTLQSEIHAGREDCKVLTEDVATIKHHLDHSNMSMDLDESMNFELANDSLPGSPQSKKCNMPDIQEERPLGLYTVDKNDCLNYYLDKTGAEKTDLTTSNIKIMDIMKLLHNTLVTRHGNEVENLVNQLKDYQETQVKLQTQISDMNADYSKIKKDLEKRDNSLNFITNVVTQLRDNLRLTEPGDIKPLDFDTHAKISGFLKDKFLTILDNNFNLSSVTIFEQITNHTNKLVEDYNSVSDALTQTKCHLSEKEQKCNILQTQNERIREINNAVTLDIIQKEQENNSIIKETYQKLVELNMISPDKIPLTEPTNVHVLIRLLEHFINEYQKEKAKVELSLEIDGFKTALVEKEREIKELKSHNEVLQTINTKNTEEIKNFEKVKSTLNTKFEENAQNLNVIQNLSKEINKLKEIITNKEQIILSLSDKDAKANELLNTVRTLQNANEKLKIVNEMISKERESYASELEKSCATIKQNNIDIDKMTSDILVLRESMKEATAHMEKLKQELQSLAKENFEVKQELEIKSRDCSRLEINIKTHEKTAEIQSRMIMRLQKLKEEDDQIAISANEKLANLSGLSEKYAALQDECEVFRMNINTANEEIENLKIAKESLENRLAAAEESGQKSRTSIDAIAEAAKRRRQSLHDSKRLFDELQEHKNLEDVFASRQKPEDLFMDVDDTSGRSTPFGLVKGRDSLLSKGDHSDKDDEHPSRPSSVLARATRRRRQSSHDLHRSVTPHAPSPTDLSNYVIDEQQQFSADTSRNRLLSDNEITQLRTQLASCEQELEDLKEQYKELDQECEICAEYLRERDEQCTRLKKEKAALENQVMELKTKADTPSSSPSLKTKPGVANVAVNTDEDWTNLHSVVVDRMSYDAEVEKNKKLTRTIEELRFTKLDLKNTLGKMQKALERNSAKDNSRELEQTKQELKSCKEELKELRTRYKELDEECDTCAEYLKEREEQCRRLQDAKASLEAKLQELQDKSHALEQTKTLRKKRQTIHDMNRPETSSADQTDASTETTADFTSSQMSRDDSAQVATDESSRDAQNLRKIVERLTQQKAHLEYKLRAAHAANPMFVATGSAIVQNQQITDVMKENQKLKKINAKLVNICKKRGKSANRENEDPCEQG